MTDRRHRRGNDADILASALSRTQARGKTALYDAVARAMDYLHLGLNSRQVLVVVSDGGDNSSSTPREQIMERARRGEAVVYSIGLFDKDLADRDPDVLRQLSAATGGECFLPDNVEDAGRILQRIAEDIRHTYTRGHSAHLYDRIRAHQCESRRTLSKGPRDVAARAAAREIKRSRPKRTPGALGVIATERL